MVSTNMNLDALTCIQEFGVPLEVVSKTWFTIHSKTRFQIRI
jgi:hypothetical protein